VTPLPTCVLDDVVPEVEEAPALAEVEPLSVDVAVEVPVLGVAADELDSVLAAELAELSCDVDDVVVESAPAAPGEETTIAPIPNAAANAPTRPM
jgi:hypothetical protein